MYDPVEAELMKDRIRQRLAKPQKSNVQQYYKKTGFWLHVAKHPMFDHLTLVVIGANSVYLGVDTDYNKPASGNLVGSPWVFQVFAHFFCAYFLIELIARCMAFKDKLNAVRDAWFVFDSLLVALMVVETWILPIVTILSGAAERTPLAQASVLRLFRLLRLSRMVRMLRSLPELMILVRGIVASLRSVLYVLGLLATGTSVFAVAFRVLSRGTEFGQEVFATVPGSIYSLFVHAAFLDELSNFCNLIRAESVACLFLALLFVAFANWTMLNMLIGVMTTVVGSVASAEREERLTQMLCEKIKGCAQSLDSNFDGRVSYSEFCRILEVPDALRSLTEVGVDPIIVLDFAEEIFFEDGQPIDLDFDKFLELVLDLRNSNVLTLKDAKTLWKNLKPRLVRERRSIQDLREAAQRDASRLDAQIGMLFEEMRHLGRRMEEPAT